MGEWPKGHCFRAMSGSYKMKKGDLVEILEPYESLQDHAEVRPVIGILVRRLSWRELYPFHSGVKAAWKVYIAEKNKTIEYDEKYIKVISEVK